MGDSLPPPAAIDLVGSYAKLAGPDAELVLWDPKLDSAIESIVLRKASSTVAGTVVPIDDASGRRLVARVPRAQLSDGIWSVTAQSGAGPDEPIDARLLVQGKRPLVLLWGGKTTPSITPTPRAKAAVAGSAAPALAAPAQAPLKRQIAAAGGRVLDRGLAKLPPEQAGKVRAAARKAARRVLP